MSYYVNTYDSPSVKSTKRLLCSHSIFPCTFKCIYMFEYDLPSFRFSTSHDISFHNNFLHSSASLRNYLYAHFLQCTQCNCFIALVRMLPTDAS